MINRVQIFAVLIFMLFSATVFAAELSIGEKDTIYIGTVQVQPSVTELARKHGTSTQLKRIAASLETQLISSLNASKMFQLIERDISAAAGAPEDEAVARAGRPAGAKFAFLPQIDGFEDSAETVQYSAIGRTVISHRLFLSVVVQIVDTNTGKLLPESPSIQLTKSGEAEKSGSGQMSGTEQFIVTLAREMALKLSQEIVSALRPAKVLSVSGKQIMFNRGTESGFEKGDLVEIYVVQKVKDDDTGEFFINETPVGQAIIVRLDKKQSFANISGDDLGITNGAVVRKLKSAAVRRFETEQPSADPTRPDFGESDTSVTTPGSNEKPFKWK